MNKRNITQESSATLTSERLLRLKAADGSALQQAGISETDFKSENISLRELSSCTVLRVHSLSSREILQSKIHFEGIELPGNVNEILGQDPVSLCQAPGDWLVLSEFLSFQRLASEMLSQIDPSDTAVLDCSAGYCVFRLSGEAGPWLLSKLSGLDFHQANSLGPHGTRTRMQHVALSIFYRRPQGSTNPAAFDLVFERSYAAYFWRLLLASASHAEELFSRHGNSL